jgi:hypothetical protein
MILSAIKYYCIMQMYVVIYKKVKATVKNDVKVHKKWSEME